MKKTLPIAVAAAIAPATLADLISPDEIINVADGSKALTLADGLLYSSNGSGATSGHDLFDLSNVSAGLPGTGSVTGMETIGGETYTLDTQGGIEQLGSINSWTGIGNTFEYQAIGGWDTADHGLVFGVSNVDLNTFENKLTFIRAADNAILENRTVGSLVAGMKGFGVADDGSLLAYMTTGNGFGLANIGQIGSGDGFSFIDSFQTGVGWDAITVTDDKTAFVGNGASIARYVVPAPATGVLALSGLAATGYGRRRE